jgi:hypothetical protein
LFLGHGDSGSRVDRPVDRSGDGAARDSRTDRLDRPSGVDTPVATDARDIVVIVSADYRQGMQRLTVVATSSEPSAVLTLLPYTSTSANTVAGGTLSRWDSGAGCSITLFGVAEPSGSVTVTSSLGGSATMKVDVRQ